MGRISTLPLTAMGRSWILCMPRMAACGGFRIGVDIKEPNTAIGDGEGSAGHFFNAQFSIASAQAKIADTVFNISKPHVLGVAQYRHDKALLGGNRHAYILIAVIDNVVAINDAFTAGMRRRASTAALTKKLIKSRRVPLWAFFKLVFVFVAQGHNRAHIHPLKVVSMAVF